MDECERNKYKQIIDNDNLIIEDLVQWVVIEREKKDLSNILVEMGYNKIAIYGYGYLGRLLEKAIDSKRIEVVCIMDRKAETNFGYYRKPEGELIVADAIIVTAPLHYREIKELLIEKGYKCDIRLIDDILFQM